jgi:uncharacterized protein
MNDPHQHGVPHAPARYRIAILTWIGIYPALTFTLWLFGLLGLANLPLPLRTLVLTAVLVPAMVYGLMPTLTRLFARWLGTK